MTVSKKFITGLDLGQSQDPSALVVVEQTTYSTVRESDYAVRHIHRWHLGTSYPEVVENLHGLFSTGYLVNSTLVIDATGVGRAVVDMIRESKITAIIKAYSITAGRIPSEDTVPKKDLVGAVQSGLQSRRIKIASDLPFREVLTKELEMFRVKVTADRNETFSAWRESDHDDMVLALALAVWYGDRQPGNQEQAYTPKRTTNPNVDRLTGLDRKIFG